MNVAKNIGNGHGLNVVERKPVVFPVGRVTEESHRIGVLRGKDVVP